jgi:hypothetical protein
MKIFSKLFKLSGRNLSPGKDESQQNEDVRFSSIEPFMLSLQKTGVLDKKALSVKIAKEAILMMADGKDPERIADYVLLVLQWTRRSHWIWLNKGSAMSLLGRTKVESEFEKELNVINETVAYLIKNF